MRKIAVFFLAMMTLAGVRAQTPDATRIRLSAPEVRKEIVAVVSAQLDAFRADDWEKAYSYSARTFQSVMSLDQFATLISRNYTVVWKNTRAEFALPSDNGRVAVVAVRVFSGGKSEAYNWLLVKEGGTWRITGVVPQKTDTGA